MTDSVQRAAQALFETIPKVNRALRAVIFASNKATFSMPQYRILSYLKDFGRSTMAVLAEQEGVKAPTMSRFVDALEAQGLVRREPSAQDKRSILVALTEAGAHKVRQVRHNGVDVVKTALSNWSVQELELITTAMDLLRFHQLDWRIS